MDFHKDYDKLLLKNLNISNVEVTGDTRFDSVLENYNSYTNDKTITKFLHKEIQNGKHACYN